MAVTWDPPASWDDMELDARDVPYGESARNMMSLQMAICERRNALGENWCANRAFHETSPSSGAAEAMSRDVLDLYSYHLYPYLRPERPVLPEWEDDADEVFDMEGVLPNPVEPSDLDHPDRNFMAAMPGCGRRMSDWGEWMRRMKNALDYLHVRDVSGALVRCETGAERTSTSHTFEGDPPGDDGHGGFNDFSGLMGVFTGCIDDLAGPNTPTMGGEFCWRDGNPVSGTHHGAEIRVEKQGTRSASYYYGKASAGGTSIFGVRTGNLHGRAARLLVARHQRVRRAVVYAGPPLTATPGTYYQDEYVAEKISETARIVELGTFAGSDGYLRANGDWWDEGWFGVGWLGDYASPLPRLRPEPFEEGVPIELRLDARYSFFAFLDHGVEGGFRFYDDTYPTASPGPIT